MQRFEEQLRELFGQFGTIAQLQTRCKLAPYADGRSWALVTFTGAAAVRRVMRQNIVIPEFAVGDAPAGRAQQMTELVRLCSIPTNLWRRRLTRVDWQVVNHMDTNRLAFSPYGYQTAKKHIAALELSKRRYLEYLPEHHPTLVRLEYKLSQFKHQAKDVAGAEFAEQVRLCAVQ